MMQGPNFTEAHMVVERESNDAFGANPLNTSPMTITGDGTPRSARTRKEINYREQDIREFERAESLEEWEGDLSDWGGLPPQPVEHTGKRMRPLDFAEILDERSWREMRRIALEGGSATTPQNQARVQLLSHYSGSVPDLATLHTELAFGDGFGGHLARYPMFAAAPHPARHDLREPLSQRALMLGGISSGVVVRGEVTEVHQAGSGVRMSFFLNGRLFEGALSAQQPIVKSSITHPISGQASVTVKVVADAKGQRRPAVTLTASHQAGAGVPTPFIPGNPTFISSSPASFSPQTAAFIGAGGAYTLPPGSFVTSAGGFGHPATCFIAPAVCFAQGAGGAGAGAGGFNTSPAPGAYSGGSGGGGVGGVQAPVMMAMAAGGAEGAGHDGGEQLHETDPTQTHGDAADRYVS